MKDTLLTLNALNDILYMIERIRLFMYLMNFTSLAVS